MKTLQFGFLLFGSIAFVAGGMLFIHWRGTVGLDLAAAEAKNLLTVCTMVMATLGLVLAGDKALVKDSFWAWLRNRGAQSIVLLIVANLVCLAINVWLAALWYSYRPVTVYSDAAVVLSELRDFEPVREIGLLAPGVEREVLMRVGEQRFGIRLVGSEARKVGDRFTVPPRGQPMDRLIFINAKDIVDDTSSKSLPKRLDPGGSDAGGDPGGND